MSGARLAIVFWRSSLLHLQLRLALRELGRGVTQLAGEVELVGADGVGEVRGAAAVLGVLGVHRGLEGRRVAVAHVELRGPLLHLGAELGGAGAQLRDPRLGVGDLGLQLGLLGLGVGDLGREGGGLGPDDVEALLGEGQRVARGLVGRVGRRRARAPRC